MSPAARQPPRFVPTLTEVIDPDAGNPQASHPVVDVDALVATVWQQIQPTLALKLQLASEQWLRATVAQQLQEFNVRMQSDMELLVRQAVRDALTPQNRSNSAQVPPSN